MSEQQIRMPEREQAIARLLSCRYGDGGIYLPRRAQQSDTLEDAIAVKQSVVEHGHLGISLIHEFPVEEYLHLLKLGPGKKRCRASAWLARAGRAGT